RERGRGAGVRSDIEVSLVERQRLDDRSEVVKNSADDRGFAPVNVEPRREDNQVRAALQGHESWHRRTHTELARFIIARRQYAPPITRAAHAYRFAAQGRTIAHLDGGIKAIHVQMDDG